MARGLQYRNRPARNRTAWDIVWILLFAVQRARPGVERIQVALYGSKDFRPQSGHPADHFRDLRKRFQWQMTASRPGHRPRRGINLHERNLCPRLFQFLQSQRILLANQRPVVVRTRDIKHPTRSERPKCSAGRFCCGWASRQPRPAPKGKPWRTPFPLALAFALRAAFPILGRIRVKPLKPDSTATESAGNRPRQTAPAVPQNPRKRVCSIPKITNENLFSISAPCRRSHARLRQSGPIQLLFRLPFVKMAGN